MATDSVSGADPELTRAATFKPPSIAAGGMHAVAFRVVELAALILLVGITSRFMAPAGRGLYALASLTAALCSLPLGAIWVANAVEFSKGRTTLRELFGASIVVAGVGGLTTAAIACAFAPLLGDRWWLIALPAIVTPASLLVRYMEGLYTALGHVRAVNLIRVGRAVLPLAFITPPLVLHASTRTAIAIWALSFIALPPIVFLPMRSMIGAPRLPRDRGLYRRIVTYGFKISGLNAMDVLDQRAALIALAVFTTDAALGIYSVAVAAAQVLELATHSLTLTTFRRISSSPRDVSVAMTARTVRHCILIGAVASVVLVPVTWVGIPWTVGRAYGDVPWLLALLIPDILCLAALAPLYTFFQVQAERPGVILRVSASNLAGHLLLTLALTPHWGIWGAATAASVASLCGTAVAIRYFLAESGTSLADLRPGRNEVRDYVRLASSGAGLLHRRA